MNNPVLLLAGVLLALLFQACSPSTKETGTKARAVVDSCIAAHGGEQYAHSCIRFDFREKRYIRFRNQDRYVFVRSFRDSTGHNIRDIIDNGRYYRTTDGKQIPEPEKASAHKASLNAVMYFAMLPYRLHDPAVKLSGAEKTSIREEPYYRIRVTFREKGGGQDHEDIYMYWIHREDYTMDYLAYRYYVNNGGVRFREVMNTETVKGIRFQDYINYKPASIPENLQTLETLFEKKKLKEVSRIIKENIQVLPGSGKEKCLNTK